MICRSCESSAEPQGLLSVKMIVAMRMTPIMRHVPLIELGLFDRCADCFWWRLALLLGYCIL